MGFLALYGQSDLDQCMFLVSLEAQHLSSLECAPAHGRGQTVPSLAQLLMSKGCDGVHVASSPPHTHTSAPSW